MLVLNLRQDDSSPQRLTPAYYPIPALCPTTGGKRELKLTHALASRIMKYGPQARYYDVVGDRTDSTTGSPVQQVLLGPTAIFAGIREHQQGGTCYCGHPTCAYSNGGAKLPPIPGMIYLVYVSPRDEIFEWRWDQADKEQPDLPVGYNSPNRFRVQIWPRR